MKKLLITIVGTLALLCFGAAVPALAQSCGGGDGVSQSSCGATATVTVPSTISITGVTDVSFPDTAAGQTALAPDAENYTVTTNNADGYTLTLTGSDGTACGQPGFSAPSTLGGNCIPNQGNLSITETGAGAGASPGLDGADITQINATQNPSTDSYSEDWSLAIPSDAAWGDYTEDFTYLAQANS